MRLDVLSKGPAIGRAASTAVVVVLIVVAGASATYFMLPRASVPSTSRSKGTSTAPPGSVSSTQTSGLTGSTALTSTGSFSTSLSTTSPSVTSSGSTTTGAESCQNSSFWDQCVVDSLALPECGTNNSLFSVSPFSFSDFTNILPLGLVVAGGHVLPAAQIYFSLKQDSQGLPVNAPLLSPGNLTIYEIQGQTKTDGNSTWADYHILFAVCKGVVGQFYTLSALSGAVLDSFVPPFDSCSDFALGSTQVHSCNKSVSVSVTAGEQIATAGGAPSSSAIDFRVQDFRIPPLQFANDSMYANAGEAYPINTACPLDYFTPTLKSSLYSLLGGFNYTSQTVVKRTAQPLCGTIEQDIPGTVQGNWFAANDTCLCGEEEGGTSIALIHDNLDPTQPLFSVGSSAMSASGLGADDYYFTAAGSGLVNRDFGAVTSDGQIYCYQLLAGSGNVRAPFVIILQLVNANQLKMERQSAASCGTGPWSFTSNYTTFQR